MRVSLGHAAAGRKNGGGGTEVSEKTHPDGARAVIPLSYSVEAPIIIQVFDL